MVRRNMPMRIIRAMTAAGHDQMAKEFGPDWKPEDKTILEYPPQRATWFETYTVPEDELYLLVLRNKKGGEVLAYIVMDADETYDFGKGVLVEADKLMGIV